MWSWVTRVLVGALCLLAGVITVEIVLRATGWGLSDKSLHALHELRLDRPWLYGLRPGIEVKVPATGDVVYRINEDGFRDRRYPKTPPDGAFRIMVLGNSVGFGYGVEEPETFATRLEEVLNGRSSAGGVEVLNFSVNGYNAYNQAAQLDDVGLAYHPNLVLVQFSVGVLHNPTLHFDHQTQMHLGMIPAEAFPNPDQRRAPPEHPWMVRLCSRLRICAFVDERILEPRRREIDPLPGLASVGPRELPAGPEREWLRARYNHIRRSAASVGAGFAVVVFPYKEQVYGSASGRLQEQLAELGREEGWLMIDLLPALRRAAATDPELYVDTWHVTASGNQLAAEVIAEQLAAAGLVRDGARPAVQ